MRRIAKHNATQIAFTDFSGGINVASTGDLIAQNELQTCQNFWLLGDQCSLAPRGGLMTMDEWIAAYDRKNPYDPFQRDERFALFYQPDHGFCEVMFTDKMAIIGQMSGDARYWRSRIDEAARKAGINHAGTIGIRGCPLAYFRLNGYVLDDVEEITDGKRYYGKHKTTGKACQASPAFMYADGRQAYFITWEI